jgi:hypothetical protein
MSQAGIINTSTGPFPPTIVETLTGNSGVATSSENNINVVTANTTVQFIGAGSTLTQNFGLSNLLIGSSGPSISGASDNVGLGDLAMNSLTSGVSNVAVGFGALEDVTDAANCVAVGALALNSLNDGASNGTVAIGYQALEDLTSGVQNTAIGYDSLTNISTQGYNTCVGWACGNEVTGDHNTAMGSGALCQFNGGACTNNTVVGAGCLISAGAVSYNTGMGSTALGAISTGSSNSCLGYQSLLNLVTGSYNIAIGQNSGLNYSTGESSNILIGNIGVGLENNVMRIGTQGSGNGQQTQTYLAGVLNTLSGRVVPITNPASYPYTTLITDDTIIVNTSSTSNTITPLASPVTGTKYVIKDGTGLAGTNNITITPSGKNIDGSSSYVIANNYGSLTIVFNGTQWSVI